MRVLELFAGYGSQALALENLGIEFTSDISEIDKYAIQAYNQLHGETHNWGDITKIDEKKLPYYDLITYSSPCQDFSVAGLGKGGDAGSGTRSSLLWECERIIRAVKPKYLLMENVKNLVGKKHKHNFIRWLRVLEMMGYQNYWQVLNAKDYGVPQNRERVFVVSILGCGQYLFPNPVKLEKRLKDVLESVVDEKYYLNKKMVEFFTNNSKANAEKGNGFRFSPSDGNGCGKAITTRAGGRMDDNYIVEPSVNQIGNLFQTDSFGGNPQTGRVYSDDGLSPTLNTMQGGGREPKIFECSVNAKHQQDLIQHQDGVCRAIPAGTHASTPHLLKTVVNNYRIRKLTPRECWRLMGVKDEQYDKLHNISNTQLYKMAGNSIVVDVLMGIFKNLFLENDSTGQLNLFAEAAQ